MAVTLAARTRSFKMQGTTPISSVRITFTKVPKTQRVLPSQGINDVVSGVLIQPISAKYSNLALVRWCNEEGTIQGVEQTIDFKDTELYPPSETCTGFEIYVKQGSVFTVTIENNGGEMNLTDYYTKTEVNALLASLPPQVDAYTKAQTDALLALKQASGSYYTQTQVNALVAAAGKGFTYDQTATPSNPSSGQTWRERPSGVASPIDWFYNGTLNVWQGIDIKEIGCTATFTAMGGIAFFSGDARYDAQKLRLVQMSTTFFVSTLNNATNYWTYYLSLFGSTTAIGATASTQSNAATTVVLDAQNLTSLLNANSNAAFAMNWTKVGSPGGVFACHTLRYRTEK